MQQDGSIRNLIPVSYTHLDVYKRQQHSCWYLREYSALVEIRPVLSRYDQYALIAGNLQALGRNERVLHLGHLSEFAQVWACLLYTSRCV